MKRRYIASTLLLACLTAFAGDPPKEGAPIPKPGDTPKWDHVDTTNGPRAFSHDQAAAEARKAPQQLESVKAVTVPAPAAATAATKPPAVIAHNCWVIEVNGTQIILVPEKYWGDLTNTYKATFVKRIGFPEP